MKYYLTFENTRTTKTTKGLEITFEYILFNENHQKAVIKEKAKFTSEGMDIMLSFNPDFDFLNIAFPSVRYIIVEGIKAWLLNDSGVEYRVLMTDDIHSDIAFEPMRE
jgi:hypothetical protein